MIITVEILILSIYFQWLCFKFIEFVIYLQDINELKSGG